jgi:hypothetical protein
MSSFLPKDLNYGYTLFQKRRMISLLIMKSCIAFGTVQMKKYPTPLFIFCVSRILKSLTYPAISGAEPEQDPQKAASFCKMYNFLGVKGC